MSHAIFQPRALRPLIATGILVAAFGGLCARKPPRLFARPASGPSAAAGVRRAPGQAVEAAPAPAPVYTREIAPLVSRACASCHRPGTSAPFSLLTYHDVQKRAGQIAAVTRIGYMPPWLPDAGHGDFVGSRRLSESQIRLIGAWASAGALEGSASGLRPTNPSPRAWPLGPPDLVVRMGRPFVLDAADEAQCRSFLIPHVLTRDRYLRAVDYRAGAPAVVRRASLFIDGAGKARTLQQQSGAVGWVDFSGSASPDRRRIGEWAVGGGAVRYPRGGAALLRRGDDLVLQLRFQPDGQAEEERSEIALYFASAPSAAPATVALGNASVTLRSNEVATVTDAFVLPVAARVYGVSPHAELMCRSIRADATLPNGAVKPLLLISQFNLDWAEPLRYRTPVELPAGARISVALSYDNSKNNPRNAEGLPMVTGPGFGCTEDSSGVEFQMVAARPQDAPVLARALSAKRDTYAIESTGATGHG